jgi:hypothetical protein
MPLMNRAPGPVHRPIHQRLLVAAGALALVTGLAACGSAAAGSPPSNRPKPAAPAADKHGTKPTVQLVPSGIKVVTAVLSDGLNPGEGRRGPTTITSPTTITRIRDLVNALPLTPTGVYSCPADFGQDLTLSFLHKSGARPVAVVIADVSGCEGVEVMHGGTRLGERSGDKSGFAGEVERILGWHVAA